jgi:NTE family protein
MKAYAVLAGGGAKGAALVGCLKAAELLQIEFVGYGGTSAGALVATLAAVGYTADELLVIMKGTPFSHFVQDAGSSIDRLANVIDDLSLPKVTRHYWTVRSVYRNLGLSNGDHLTNFVHEKISDKYVDLKTKSKIEFQDLDKRAKPLKIVASDLQTQAPKIYSMKSSDDSVTEAVRASTSYPFVFKPVLRGESHVVDGGLCSNLPTFLFDREREQNGLPVVAFDLAGPSAPISSNYGFKRFCLQMMDTAMTSGDQMRRKSPGVELVVVQVPSDISTLDFNLTSSQIDALHNSGLAGTLAYFAARAPQWYRSAGTGALAGGEYGLPDIHVQRIAEAKGPVEMLQAVVGVPSSQVVPILRAMARDFEDRTKVTHVRANIMLPTPSGTRRVVYQFGMDADSDADLELAADSGCSGRAWSTRKPTACDLAAARTNYSKEWGMTDEQQSKVRADRQAMFSFPMFDPQVGNGHQQLIGIASVDTDTPLAQTNWTNPDQTTALNLGIQWAEVLSRLLT